MNGVHERRSLFVNETLLDLRTDDLNAAVREPERQHEPERPKSENDLYSDIMIFFHIFSCFSNFHELSSNLV